MKKKEDIPKTIIVNKNKQTKKWLKRYMEHVFLTDYQIKNSVHTVSGMTE